MDRPRLLIIVLFQNLAEENIYYYSQSPAPPLPGLLLAGLTPDTFDIEVLHEMERPVDYATAADFIAMSFMDYCAPHAFEVAKKFKALGKTVIAGGRYASTFPQEVIPYFDVTVVGEAHAIWGEVCKDMLAGNLKKIYEAPLAPRLDNIPAPRYDLAERGFITPVVTEATRGCKFRCKFCHLTVQNLPYRKRPIQDVINDLRSVSGLPLIKRKVGMIYDNNFACDMKYAKELLREIAKLKYWGLGFQFSFECLHDDEFVDLLEKAHCSMAFIGLESLNEPSLAAMHKTHNKVSEYKELFYKLKKRGILTFAGIIVGIDEDTPEYYQNLSQRIEETDPSIILSSIAIPIPGTLFHKTVESEERITDRNLCHYEGDHLVFKPSKVTRKQVSAAYRDINRQFFSFSAILRRWFRIIAAYLFSGHFFRKLPRMLFISYIYFELTYFEIVHAKNKVFKNLEKDVLR